MVTRPGPYGCFPWAILSRNHDKAARYRPDAGLLDETPQGRVRPRTMSRPVIPDAPIALRTTAWADYGLIDSGNGRKLERYGPYRVVRPEPQCLWTPRPSAAE